MSRVDRAREPRQPPPAAGARLGMLHSFVHSALSRRQERLRQHAHDAVPVI